MLTAARPCLTCALILTLAGALPLGAGEPLALLPVPAEASPGPGALALGTALPVWWDGAPDPLLERAVGRLARRLAAETGVPARVERAASAEQAALCVHAPAADPRFLTLEADEA